MSVTRIEELYETADQPLWVMNRVLSSGTSVAVGYDILDTATEARRAHLATESLHRLSALHGRKEWFFASLRPTDSSPLSVATIYVPLQSNAIALYSNSRLQWLSDHETEIIGITERIQAAGLHVDPWLAAYIAALLVGRPDAVSGNKGLGGATRGLPGWLKGILAKPVPKSAVWAEPDLPVGQLLRVLRLLWPQKNWWERFLNERPRALIATDLSRLACALDIELGPDGEVQQVGLTQSVARGVKYAGRFLNDRPALLARLADHFSSRPICVGHNVVAHDMPKLRSYCGFAGESAELLWDTLWTSSGLAPWEASHALPNSLRPHDALEDAKASLSLFHDQLNQLGPELVAKALVGVCASEAEPSARMLGVLAERIPAIPLPATESHAGAHIVVPTAKLASHLWSSDRKLGRAEALALPEQLGAEVLGTRSTRGTASVRLAMMIRERAQSHSKTLHALMLPEWLRIDLDRTQAVDLSFEAIGEGTLIPEELAVVGVAMGFIDPADIPAKSLKQGPEFRPLRSLTSEESQGLDRWECPHCRGRLAAKIQELNGRPRCPHHPEEELRPSGSSALGRWTVQSELVQQWGLRSDARLEYSLVWRPWLQFHQKSGWQLSVRWSGEDSSVPSSPSLKPGFVQIPDWLADDVEIEELRGAPDSLDRVFHWGVLFPRLIALASTNVADVLLLAVRDDPERRIVEEMMMELGLSESVDGYSRYRQLERAVARGPRYILVRQEQLLDWLRSAQRLPLEVAARIAVVVPELPLEDWSEWATSATRSRRATIALIRARSARVAEWWNEILGIAEGVRGVCMDVRLLTGLGGMPEWCSRVTAPTEPASQSWQDVFRGYSARFGPHGRAEVPRGLATHRKFLEQHWPFADFRPSQLPGVTAIAESDADVLVSLATGEGKSIMFQVPALLAFEHTKRLTLVISPLKALMQDQVASLQGRFGKIVDLLTSDQSRGAAKQVLRRVAEGDIGLLYVAPERLQNPLFRAALEARIQRDEGLAYVVFDEAHCITEWGHEFRPTYLRAFWYLKEKIGPSRAIQGRSRALLFSATMTGQVRASLRALLAELDGAIGARSLVCCPELPVWPLQEHVRLAPQAVVDGQGRNRDDRLQERLVEVGKCLADGLLENSESTAIVFVQRRVDAVAAAHELEGVGGGITAAFHAGLSAERRALAFDRFKRRSCTLLTATSAFGMGMDVPHIHRSIHLGPPSSLEALVQEAGRLGRSRQSMERAGIDIKIGLRAHVLHSSGDFERLQGQRAESQLTEADLHRLWGACTAGAGTALGQRWCWLSDDWDAGQGRAAMQSVKTDLALYWLEHAGRCSVVGRVQDVLEVEVLSPEALATAAREAGRTGALAAQVLSLLRDPGAEQARPASTGGGVSGLFRRLIGVVLRSLGGSAGSTGITTVKQRGNPERLQLSLGPIARQMGSGLSRDAVFREVIELQRRGVLRPRRTLHFYGVRPADPSSDVALQGLQKVEALAKKLLRYRTIPVQRLDCDTLSVLLGKEVHQQHIDAAVGLLVALRLYAPVIRDGRAYYRRGARAHRSGHVAETLSRVLDLAERALQKLQDRASTRSSEVSIESADLFALLGQKDGREALESALCLLADLGLAYRRQPLVSCATVLTLLAEPEAAVAEERFKRAAEEMLQGQQRAELRTAALECGLHLEAEVLREHIEHYFTAANDEQLRDCVSQALVGIPPEVDLITTALVEGQRQLRAGREERLASLLEDLVPIEKRQAVEAPFSDKMYVLAGPGAGKTHLLESRAAYLVQSGAVRPAEIMLLAFNRAIVAEVRKRMYERFRALGFGGWGGRIRCHTFHALAAKHTPNDEQLGIDERMMRFAVDCRSRGLAAEAMRGVRLLMVDEWQDCDAARSELVVNLLRAAPGVGLTCVGDPNQAIMEYGRNNDPALGERTLPGWLDKQLSKHGLGPLRDISMRVNMRSEQEIIAKAEEVLNDVPNALRSSVVPQRAGRTAATAGKVVIPDGDVSQFRESAVQALKGLARGESGALLCRSNVEADAWARYLKAQGIPGVRSIAGNLRESLSRVREWRELSLVLASRKPDEQLAKADVEDAVSGLRTRSICCASDEVEALWQMVADGRSHVASRDWTTALDRLTLVDLAWESGRWLARSAGRTSVSVSTIHRAKGLEFDVVVLPPSVAPFPFGFSGHTGLQAQAQEEARVAYVGCTRARRLLVLGWDDREKAWCPKGSAAAAAWRGSTWAPWRLQGSRKEVYLDWGWRSGVQASVQPGDPVVVQSNGTILRNGQKVWQLSREAIEKVAATKEGLDCEVVQIVWHEPKDEYLKHILAIDAAYPGGHYVPLVREVR